MLPALHHIILYLMHLLSGGAICLILSPNKNIKQNSNTSSPAVPAHSGSGLVDVLEEGSVTDLHHLIE